MGAYCYELTPNNDTVPCDEYTGAKQLRTDSIGTVRISTVFLGLNHQIDDDGPPLIFETMVFPSEDQWRFSTYDEAIHFHDQKVAELNAAPTNPEE